MANTYPRNFIVATNHAAKVYGVDAAELRKHYRDFKSAPSELKAPLLLTYKMMRKYRKPAVEQAVEEQ